jgi:integrase
MKRRREVVYRGERGDGTIFFFVDENGEKIVRNLYIFYRAGGKEYLVSARTDELGDAKRELKRLVRNRENARDGLDSLKTPKAERLTVREIVAAYLDNCEFEKKATSIKAMRSHAKPMLEALGSARAVELGAGHVARYKAHRRESVSAAKLSRELEILKASFNFAAAEEVLRSVPIIKLPAVKNARKVFFPIERVRELLEALGKRDENVRDFLDWLSFTGMRPKAVRLLRWSDLDRIDWVLTLRAEDDKNEAGRDLAVEGEAREIIGRRLARMRLGDVYIFGGVNPLSEKLVRNTWDGALADLKLPVGMKDGYVVYDLKKTALRAIRRSGVPEERAMYFSGHKTSNTFNRYNITAQDDNREDMKRATEYRQKRFAESRREENGK